MYCGPSVYGRDLDVSVGLHNTIQQVAPTHTEDGIPIRKLYISNLPFKTTRYELMECFRQYGWIKSCWVRMEDNDRRQNALPSALYAFITFVNPDDAHRALTAPLYEKIIRGRILKTMPADSWHQPAEDANGEVIWNQHRVDPNNIPSTSSQSSSNPNVPNTSEEITIEEKATQQEDTVKHESELDELDMINILNRDCLIHLFSFISLREIIILERVNKRWQAAVQDYLTSVCELRTSLWMHSGQMTTAVLRHVLQRVGPSLKRLHIDHMFSHALNDRTAHTVGKFCPNLEEITIIGMKTKKWNPIIYGCKQLKDVKFYSCWKITDRSLMPLVNHPISSVESLSVIANNQITGLFLKNIRNKPNAADHQLKRLFLKDCVSLQPHVLVNNIQLVSNLTTLKLDNCTIYVWKAAPEIIKKLPKLEYLSLSEYSESINVNIPPEQDTSFTQALAMLPNLKQLIVSHNMFINNEVLKQLGKSCPKLKELDISFCAGTRHVQSKWDGVSDEGLIALTNGCQELKALHLSHLPRISNCGLNSIASCGELVTLVARGSDRVTSDPFCKILRSCGQLRDLDICGCQRITPEIVKVACEVLEHHPRSLLLRLAGTPTADEQNLPQHPCLTLIVTDDISMGLLIENLCTDDEDDDDDDDIGHFHFDGYEEYFDDDFDMYDIDDGIPDMDELAGFSVEDMLHMPVELYFQRQLYLI